MQVGEAAQEQNPWRASAGWIALAVFTVLFSLGTNLYEFLAADLLRAIPVLVANPVDRLIDDGARLLLCGVGLVILLRAKGRRSAFILGIGLAALSPFPVEDVLPESTVKTSLYIAFAFCTSVLSFLIAAFAISMLQESEIGLPRFVRWAFWVGLALAVVIWSTIFMPQIPVLNGVLEYLYYGRFALLPFLLSMALLLFGWLRASGDVRQRFFLLFLAVSVIISGNMLFSVFYDDDGVFPRAVTNTASALRIAGSLLFAYAILKHRVIDIGFAINRTLVYGAVAFTVLVIFGLVEYLAKVTIPHAWPQAGSVITAGIAVLLFLSFHHLHHWFEHHIERLFFHQWHVAENELKRFVGSAGQFTKESALCAEFVGELRRYAQVSDVALFLRRDDGDFCLENGQVPGATECYAEEDRAFALMRTEREPIELARAHSALPGALAVPMLDQQGLAGFVLLGGKPDGSHFRPDEEENIGWATHQVGLDLQALHARKLEEQVVSLKLQSTEKDRLLALFASERATPNRA